LTRLFSYFTPQATASIHFVLSVSKHPVNLQFYSLSQPINIANPPATTPNPSTTDISLLRLPSLLVVAAGVEPELVAVELLVVDEACTPPLAVLLVIVAVVAVINGPPEPVVIVIIMVLSVASFIVVKTPPVTDASAEARLTLMAAFV
jgi:hypothetical protein